MFSKIVKKNDQSANQALNWVIASALPIELPVVIVFSDCRLRCLIGRTLKFYSKFGIYFLLAFRCFLNCLRISSEFRTWIHDSRHSQWCIDISKNICRWQNIFFLLGKIFFFYFMRTNPHVLPFECFIEPLNSFLTLGK